MIKSKKTIDISLVAPATITWENLRSITLNGFKLNIKITDEDIELVPTNGESNGEQTASQTAEPINN